MASNNNTLGGGATATAPASSCMTLLDTLNARAERPNMPSHLRTVGTVCFNCGAMTLDMRSFLRLSGQDASAYVDGKTLKCGGCLKKN